MPLDSVEQEFFKRQVQLWGEETQIALKKKKVAIVGCGGLGSSLGIALGGAGVGELHLIDFDVLAIHNIHRQIAYTMENIDQPKAQNLAKLLEKRSPCLNARVFEEKFEDYTARNLEVDLILDATDNLPTRAQIDVFSKKKDTPWIYSSVEEWHGQACFFEKASFGSTMKVTDRKPAGIAPAIVMFIASFESNLALRYLTGDSVEKDTLHYLYFNEAGFSLQKFKMPVS